MSPAESDAELDARADRLIEKYLNPIAEPARYAGCDPRILARSKATQSARHRFTDAYGLRRERMPMGVIVASYFLRAGYVWPTTIMDVAYREDFAAEAGKGSAPRSGKE